MSILLLVFFLVAQPPNTGPVEWLSPPEHDFGDLKQGVPTATVFRFRNNTDRPLTIDNVRSTCGCTAPNWDETAIAPGDTASITIEYDAKKPGYFHKKITVYFNGLRKPEKLAITGYVE